MTLDWGDWIAPYGALLSTALGVVRFADFLRDRPRLAVNLLFEYRNPDSLPQGQYLIITAINSGRRPVTIAELGVESPKGEVPLKFYYPSGVCRPTTLRESERMEGLAWAGGGFEAGTVLRGFAGQGGGQVKKSGRLVIPSCRQ